MAAQTNTILVIFGIMGDLSRRKLIPSLVHIAEAGLLENTKIIGVTRQDLTADDVLQNLPDTSIDASKILPILEISTMDLTDQAAYKALWAYIATLSNENTQVIHYLSVPPQAAGPIIELLGTTKPADCHCKLLLEKPFGVDLSSALSAIETIETYFDDDQIYRIDHYLAKEMAQNIVAFRSHNALFRQIWSRHHIEKIEIVAAEKIGIEGRAEFYEQTGALRDFMQNHMMQLLSLVLMDIPEHTRDVPAKRLEAITALKPIDLRLVKRGQYKGYRSEVKNPDSTVETLVAMTMYSDAEQWQDVPITLLTGKHLAEKTTEIRIYFKKTKDSDSNRLVLHVQPKEGFEIDLWVKRPGYEKTYELAGLSYHNPETVRGIDAYERVLVDAFSSDKSLFTSAEEVLASWRLLEPLQRHWELHDDDLMTYEPGTSLDELL